MPEHLDFEGWVCPLPLRDTPTIVMGHGGGGAMSGELIEQLFLPAFGGAANADLGDSAVLPFPGLRDGSRLAFSTDSFVVRPMFFPGGSIGDLAVNGTVNDLAMSGATPLFLSTAFILAEGTALSDIGRVATAVGKAAEAAGVQLVTGDTKVVDSASGDGVYVNTAGIGVVAAGVEIGPRRAEVGDAVLVSGDIGVHGIAVMSCREGLEFGTTVESDTAALHGLVADLLATEVDVHVLRDPTRGGVSATLNEIAKASGVGIELVERDLPIPPEVRDACGLLGLDPLQVANEGKLVAIVPGDRAEEVLAAMRSHPLGRGARRIGTCVEEHRRMVVARTGLGGTRVVDLPIGEQLPRIC
jgi:hydrogenase expression/formation protein HypE